MTYSIWKDIYVDFGAVASVNYKVEVTGYGEVFLGKAFARPGAAKLLVRINDIIADAYGMLLHLPETDFDNLGWPMEVKVTDVDTNTQKWKEKVAFYGLKGHHILAGEEFQKDLYTVYGENGSMAIPWNMIIDREGIIVQLHAPRPSEYDSLKAALL